MRLQPKTAKLIHSKKSSNFLYICTGAGLFLLAAGTFIYFLLVNDWKHSDHHDPDIHHPNRSRSGVAIDVRSCSENGTTVLSLLRLDPYPVHMPGNVSASFNLHVGRTIRRPTTMKYKLMKKFLFWWITIDAPAASDFCDVWPLPGPHCPAAYSEAGIPCSCPISPGDYELASLSQVGILQDFGLPMVVQSGRYWAQIDVDHENGEKLLCHEMELNIN